jgi:hypothetical protein
MVTIVLPASLGGSRETRAPAFPSEASSEKRVYRLPERRIVRRARGPYLYDQQGDRYLDLWAADGAAFLGHRPGGYSRLAKEEIDRGLWGPFPTQWLHRLYRAVTALVRAEAGETGLGHTDAGDTDDGNTDGGNTDGGNTDGEGVPIHDVTVCVLNGVFPGDTDGRTISQWLPTIPFPALSRSADVSLPVGLVLPAPGMTVSGYLTVGDLPTFVLALLTRSAHLLREYLASEERRVRCDLAMELPVPPGYTRHGVWFVPNGTERGGSREIAADHTGWRSLQDRALKFGVVLPPDGATPIVVPGGIGRSDVTRWKRLCDEWSL